MDLYGGNQKIKIFDTNGIGLPSVANFALDKAKGKYIIRLDADDVFDENILLVLSNYLERDPSISLVFPDYFLMDEHGSIYAQERRQPFYYQNHMLDIPPHGACTMVVTKVLQEVGGYRTDLGAQDGFDLWNKIKKNYRSANINIPLFYYRQHGKNLTGDKKIILNAKREIKKDFSIEKIQKHRPIIAIIPCRENYDFTPNLWKQKISEKSLLDIAIERCIASELFDHIVITSDNAEVESYLAKFNDPRIIFKQRLSDTTIRSRPVAHTIGDIISKLDPDYHGITALSILQAPFITTRTMEEVIYSLVLNEADSSILVREMSSVLFERTSHGLSQINRKGFLLSDFDILYQDLGSCIASTNQNIAKGRMVGSSVVSTVSPENETHYINNAQDLKVSKYLMEKA
jgi:CMP-N-acetylneuraminic acid synthetase